MQKSKILKILILGLGYVGSELAYSLAKSNEVIVVDHGKKFSELGEKLSNVKLIKGDITNEDLIRDVTKDVDVICYCVNTGGVTDCENNLEVYKKINIDDFQKLLLNIENISSRFILFSSTFVYSNIENNDEKSITNPETLYGKLRLSQESLLVKNVEKYTILRISNIYGHENFQKSKFYNVIDRFIINALDEKDIILNGDGTQLADFVHISDLIRIFHNILENEKENSIFNISNEKRLEISEIGEIINCIASNEYNKKSFIQKRNTNKKLPDIPSTSSNKIVRDYGWKTNQDIKKRLEEIFETHFKNNLDN